MKSFFFKNLNWMRRKTAHETKDFNHTRPKIYRRSVKTVFHALMSSLKVLYENVNCAIRINDHLTPFIDVHQGVKLDCKLSPTLFSLYVNDLAQEIKSLTIGVDIDEVQLSILLYADDVALIAPDADSLQIMLNKLSEWCCKWRLGAILTRCSYRYCYMLMMLL